MSYYSFTPTAAQRFGADRGGGRKHRGVDRSSSTRAGTPVPALLGGVVVAKLAPASWHGFGHQVTIRSVYNGVTHLLSYAHGQSASPLRVGQTISAGTTVLREGTTGATTGPCVHIEDQVGGRFRDPMPLIRAVAQGASTAPAGTVGRNITSRPTSDVQRLVGANPDNRYGPDTTAKVKVWQAAHGLNPDGIWGPASDAAGFGAAPAFPLPRGWYFGPKSGPKQSVSGYHGHREDLRRWQQRMKDRGWKINPDGLYGTQSGDIAAAFQREKGLKVDRKIGPETWAAAWTAPVT